MRFQLMAVLILAMISPLQAKTLKLSTEYPDGTSALLQMRQAGKTIEQRTEGRVKLKFYPGGVMGDATAVLRKIRIGQLHGAFIQSGALANDYKDSQVLNAPLLFRDFKEVDIVRSAMDDSFNNGYQEAGWFTFGVIEGGFAYAMTNTAADSLSVLRDQKIWLPANDPLSAKIAKVFNINPIVLNIGDVLTALQTGAINAVVAPPVGAIALQWHTKTKYLTDAPFMYTFGVIAISERHLKGISDGDLNILVEELTLASKEIDKQSRLDNEAAFDALMKLGIEIQALSDDVRMEIEQEATESTVKLISSGEFSESVYQQVLDLLSSHREQ